MGFRVWGLGFRGLGFRVWGLGACISPDLSGVQVLNGRVRAEGKCFWLFKVQGFFRNFIGFRDSCKDLQIKSSSRFRRPCVRHLGLGSASQVPSPFLFVVLDGPFGRAGVTHITEPTMSHSVLGSHVLCVRKLPGFLPRSVCNTLQSGRRRLR